MAFALAKYQLFCNKKGPDFSVETVISFRLQFPFVFRRLQSLQLLLPAHPCPPLSLPAFSGLPLSRPGAASASLSDPRCFRLLSLASVLGSDYSASVSSFPFSSCLRLTVASSVLRFFLSVSPFSTFFSRTPSSR